MSGQIAALRISANHAMEGSGTWSRWPCTAALPSPPQWLSNATQVLARTGSGPGREACFDEDARRNLMAFLAVSSLCSAGQPFSHQFDMHGILLSSKDAWSREGWIIH